MKLSSPALAAFCAATLLVCGPLAHGQIAANFTDGDGTDSVDQYTGIPGDGWTTAWQTNTAGASAGTTIFGFVETVDPLSGGGNYLSSTVIAGSGVGKGVQQRRYQNFGGIDISSPQTVSFDLRLDSDLSTFTAATDYFQAFDRPFSSDFGADGAWLIRAAGASVNGIAAQHWMLYNGGKNGGAFNNANFVDTGVPLVSGMVYHFEVNIDPALLQYTVSINGGAFSAPMGFRANTAANLGSLNFGGQVSNAGESMTYSLDSIAVVPEPSVAALCFFAGALGFVALRRPKNRS